MSQIIDTSNFDIPNDPIARDKLKKAIQEHNDASLRIAAERDLQKEILAAASEATGMKKASISKLAKMKFKANKDQVVAETDALAAGYSVLYENGAPSISASTVRAAEAESEAQDEAASAWGLDNE